MTEGLCGSPFTIDFIKDRLLSACEIEDVSRVTLNSHSAIPIGVGQGFLSKLFRVTMSWSGPDSQRLPTVVVVKCPTLETIMESSKKMNMEDADGWSEEDMNKFLPLAHANECHFFNLFSKSEQPPLLMPKCYYAKPFERDDVLDQSAVIIMQDFSTLNGVTINIADGMNVDEVEQVIDNLASLHAWSLTNQEKFIDQFARMPEADLDNWPKVMAGVAHMVTNMKPEYFEGKFEQIKWATDPDFVIEVSQRNEKLTFGIPPVVVLGDLWTNNMMFDKDTGKLLALIDFQVAHPGNPCEDIARMLVSSFNSEQRRLETPRLLALYYSNLTKYLGRKPPFELEDICKAYEVILPYAMAFYVFGVPLMCNSPVIEGPNKEQRKEEMLIRARDIIDDVIPLKKWYDQVMALLDK